MIAVYALKPKQIKIPLIKVFFLDLRVFISSFNQLDYR